MTQLNCTSTSCFHNKRGVCTSSKVNIAGKDVHNINETNCNNYSYSKGIKSSINAINNMNFYNGFQEYNNMNNHIISVNCSANNCLYNKNGYCSEEKINLDDDGSNNTSCYNFVEKF